MAVQDFALDATGMQRIQLHWGDSSEPATVLLNGSILGRLSPDECLAGKDFVLPDGSMLRVQIFNNQPYIYRNGLLLPPVISQAVQVAQEERARAKRGGCLTAWLIFVLIVNAIVGIISLLDFVGAAVAGVTNTPIMPLFFLLFGLFGLMDAVGALLLLLWKKIGFYLILASVAAGIICGFLDGQYQTNIIGVFGPLIGVAILYYLINRMDLWKYMS
jgi:hypothetical protein